MARWKPLAADLEPAVRRLTVSLREVKDSLGISIAALGRHTNYSRSSWERYMNATLFPPRGAVAALAKLSPRDEARLLAEWERAEEAVRLAVTRNQAVGMPADPTPPGPMAADLMPASPTAEEAAGRDGAAGGDRGHGYGGLRGMAALAGRRRVMAGLAGLVVVLAVGGGILLSRSGDSSAPGMSGSGGAGGGRCTYSQQDGRWYAGHSRTTGNLVMASYGGADVLEVQCLLVRLHYDPGPIDGVFGPRTKEAVEQLQKVGRVAIDGIVGPQTWALLRA